MLFTCLKTNCLKTFEVSDQAHTAICPECGTKYHRHNSSGAPNGLIRVKGQLIRSKEKIRMSKKQRLKLRKAHVKAL